MAFVSNIVSGTACLGVLIGILSGIFFLVFSGLRWARVRGALFEKEFNRQKRFLVGNSYLIDSHLTSLAEETIHENAFEETKEKSTESTDANSGRNDDQRDGNNAEKQSFINTDTIQVREFIEKLVETIIGGPLDGTTVGRLSTHSAYLGMFTKYHSLLCRELARLGFALHLSVVHENALEFDRSNSTHSNLKRLIKRIVSEAMALPNIKDILCRPKVAEAAVNDDFNNKSYEDILATAILNKVIENFQKRADAKINSCENDKPQNKSRKLNSRDDEDDLVYNSDWSDTSRSEQLSLTIEEHIEEVTTTYEVSDDEGCEPSDVEEETINHRVPFPESGRIVRDAGIEGENSDLEEQSSATELVTSTNSWEENWLFQKKRLRSTPNAHHPVPVPMLVPNPSEDYRALVGGVDADDLSDMSDCSDSVLEEMIVREDDNDEKPSHEQENRQRIEDEVEDDVPPNYATQSLVTETIYETLNEDNINSRKPEENDSSQVELLETSENEVCDVHDEHQTEYKSTEISNDTKNVFQSPTSPENVPQKDREFSVEHIEWSQEYDSNDELSRQEESIQHPEDQQEGKIRCRIAEREKEKWENPVPLAVNPYSPDNILKREERNRNTYFRIGTYTQNYIEFPDDLIPNENVRRKIESFRFARDYYVNSSKHPSGMSPTPSLNQFSDGNEQVSKTWNDGFLLRKSEISDNCRKSNKVSRNRQSAYRGFDKSPKADEQIKNSFNLLRKQTARHQHFSKVFKTLSWSEEDVKGGLWRGQQAYETHSLKLRPRHRGPATRKLSLDQELSDFEQKSLREDVNHWILRARGASPNFMLNPVFKPETNGQNVQEEHSLKETRLPFTEMTNDSGNRTKNDSDVDSEFGQSDPIVPRYRRTRLRENLFRDKKTEKKSRKSQESGYGSDSLDYSSDSLEYWRLTPPKTPEVVESSFVPVLKSPQRKENPWKVCNSLSSYY